MTTEYHSPEPTHSCEMSEETSHKKTIRSENSCNTGNQLPFTKHAQQPELGDRSQTADAANTGRVVVHDRIDASVENKASRRKNNSTGFDRQPGRRPMKEYPLTQSELYGLASLGALTTGCFSVASGLLGYASSIAKDIAFFGSNIPETALNHYALARDLSLYGSLGLFAIGVALMGVGGIRVRQIIKETIHGSR